LIFADAYYAYYATLMPLRHTINPLHAAAIISHIRHADADITPLSPPLLFSMT